MWILHYADYCTAPANCPIICRGAAIGVPPVICDRVEFAPMIQHPGWDPVALSIGPIQIHWYGISYLVGFWGCWWLGTIRARQPQWNWPRERIGDLLFYLVLGVILGGRVGYTFFYNLETFIHHPLVIFRIWEGGMSFHGGLIGVMVAAAIYARHIRMTFFDITDFIAPLVPFGLFCGRVGNFINQELWGAPSTLPWAMVFPKDPEQLPRHPSMLYEALLEGLVMLALLWLFSRKPKPRMAVSGAFLVLYGLFRTLVETVRLPDQQIDYLLGTGWITMGMVLSAPMWIGGLILMAMAYRRGVRTQAVS